MCAAWIIGPRPWAYPDPKREGTPLISGLILGLVLGFAVRMLLPHRSLPRRAAEQPPLAQAFFIAIQVVLVNAMIAGGRIDSALPSLALVGASIAEGGTVGNALVQMALFSCQGLDPALHLSRLRGRRPRRHPGEPPVEIPVPPLCSSAPVTPTSPLLRRKTMIMGVFHVITPQKTNVAPFPGWQPGSSAMDLPIPSPDPPPRQDEESDDAPRQR